MLSLVRQWTVCIATQKIPAGIPHLEHKYYDWLYIKIYKNSVLKQLITNIIMFRRDLIQNKKERVKYIYV